MSILVVAEHNNQVLNASTFNTIAAAAKLGGDIEVLVAGHNCKTVADQAAKISGVKKVIHADDTAYAHMLAENIGNLVSHVGKSHSHIVAPASFFGKNVMPRVAAMLDAVQISDIVAVESADTFVRPIYAGNAIQTVQSLDAKRVITVRTASFQATAGGGNASVEQVSFASNNTQCMIKLFILW